MVRVKICGVTTPEDARLAAELGAHAIGLNFYPESPRSISPFAARNILRELPPLVSSVGIFVNWTPEPVIALSQALRLSAAQLHGDETPQTVAEVAKKIPVIKALRIEKGARPIGLPRHRAASAFLLDAAKSWPIWRYWCYYGLGPGAHACRIASHHSCGRPDSRKCCRGYSGGTTLCRRCGQRRRIASW